MTRGNQRELARAKNQKKQQEMKKNKGNNDGLTVEQRKFRDAELMREKQRKKKSKKGSQHNNVNKHLDTNEKKMY